MSIRIACTDTEREACFDIRKAVFVSEQGVPLSLELDFADAEALHFLAIDDSTGEPVAAARLIPYGNAAKIGRVAVKRAARGQGIGSSLMEFILAEAHRLGFREARLHAQTSVVLFYERLGFLREGDEFLEAGIPHLAMRRPL